MSFHKIPNSSTSATSFNQPNTIMLRDAEGASRVSSLIMKGTDFVKDWIETNYLQAIERIVNNEQFKVSFC
jgi:chromosomal replication initiation ATPase DnaA